MADKTVTFYAKYSYHLYTEKDRNGYMGTWIDLQSQEKGGSNHVDPTEERALDIAERNAKAHCNCTYMREKDEASELVNEIKEEIWGKDKKP